MRHGKKFNHLGRTSSHRKAMLANMASSLIVNKRINTTLAKAKELRKYVEPLITKAKDDSTHSRRTVFSYLQNKDSVKELFGEVVDKVGNRPGGYTRIIKTGFRLGDNAEMCMMELVDFNELLISEKVEATSKTRRSRRSKKSSSESTASPVKDTIDAAAEVVEDATAAVAETVEEAVETVTEVVEDAVDAVSDAVDTSDESKEGEESSEDEDKKDKE